MCVKWACCVITITSCDVFVKWISFNVLCKMSILCDDKHRVMCVNWWYTYDVSVKWKSHVIMIHMGYQCLCEIYIPCDDDTYVIFLWDEHPTVMIMNITWCCIKWTSCVMMIHNHVMSVWKMSTLHIVKQNSGAVHKSRILQRNISSYIQRCSQQGMPRMYSGQVRQLSVSCWLSHNSWFFFFFCKQQWQTQCNMCCCNCSTKCPWNSSIFYPFPFFNQYCLKNIRNKWYRDVKQ